MWHNENKKLYQQEESIMKKLLIILTLLLCLSALAETPDLPAQLNPEGWRYMGYTPAGVTFLIPEDTQSYPLSDAERSAGIVFLGANAEYTVQLRRFLPDQMDLAAFQMMLRFTSDAQVETRETDGTQIIVYRNPDPTGVSELVGIALTGTDGCMYKVSIFTGVDEDCSADAPVWSIAARIADSVAIVDYSGWPVAD